jgi:SIR2-like protein
MTAHEIGAIGEGLRQSRLIPYLGPGLLETGGEARVPTTSQALVTRLTSGQPVPARIRRNLTAAAQHIENFRHRKVLRGLMLDAFDTPAVPAPLHRLLAGMKNLPLIVDTWYDGALLEAFGARDDWGQVQGVSRAEHRDRWFARFDADGAPATEEEAARWRTLVYKPIGCIRPAGNFLVSDSDYVEVLTEIDIQTPIPPEVQGRRQGRGFLFLGCRFATQLERSYARQIIKRSAGPHWAVVDGELTRNELRFLAEQQIHPVRMALGEFAQGLAALIAGEPASAVGAPLRAIA